MQKDKLHTTASYPERWISWIESSQETILEHRCGLSKRQH